MASSLSGMEDDSGREQTSTGSRDGRGLSKTVCILCRQRKVRCDRKKPSCGYCNRNSISCRYVAVVQRPGLRAGYVSELERRLTALEKEVKGLKEQTTVHVENIELPRARSTSIAEHALSTSSHGSKRSHATDFDPLAPQVLRELCNVWYTKFHPWLPILHRLSSQDLLLDVQNLVNTRQRIVFKAIVAVTIPHCLSGDSLSNEQRNDISSSLRSQVLAEAMGSLCLPSLQAVLILTVLDFGAGKLSEFWNLVALSKRMGMQLGLRDLVAHQCENFNTPSSMAPRMLPLPTNLIDQEERVRAFWMTEVLDSSSTIGAAWNIGLARMGPTDLLPCSDLIWDFPEHNMSLSPNPPSAFSTYVSLVTRELWHVHEFLQQSIDTRSATDRAHWQIQCRDIDDRLIKWRSDYAASLHETSSRPDSSFDPNIIMTRCTFNAAVIALYQRLTLPTMGEEGHGPWYHAIQRCLDACDDTTSALRLVPDQDLENVSPHLIPCIFVAARFFLVHAKTLGVEVPRNLDLLVYALRTCAMRYSYAIRLEKVLRTAMGEHKLPISMSSLPPQFYNLQYSAIDIDEALRTWAENLAQFHHLAGLDGAMQNRTPSTPGPHIMPENLFDASNMPTPTIAGFL